MGAFLMDALDSLFRARITFTMRLGVRRCTGVDGAQAWVAHTARHVFDYAAVTLSPVMSEQLKRGFGES